MPSKVRKFTTQEILDALANAEEGAYPAAAVAAVGGRRRELTPHFRRAIDLVFTLAADCKLQDEGDWRLANFGLYFLSEWRVPGTYELLMKVLELDYCDRRWLIDDAIYSEWPDLLLTTFPRRAQEVKRLQSIVLDSDVHEDVRGCALCTLGALVHYGIADRDRIVRWMEWLYECDLSTPMGFVIDELLVQSASLKEPALMKRIRALYATDWKDDPAFSLKDIEGIARKPWPRGHTAYNNVANPVTSAASLIRRWEHFLPVDLEARAMIERVVGPGVPYGRAGIIIGDPDPLCLCGSGRRQRHCCGD